jgi:hypothetical protein
VRCDGLQQYPRKLSNKKIQVFFIDCLRSLYNIFFDLANWCYYLLHTNMFGTTRLIKWAIRREFTTIDWMNRDYKIT